MLMQILFENRSMQYRNSQQFPFVGSQAEDLFWTTYRFMNPENKTVYIPNFKVLLDQHELTGTIGNEYTLIKGLQFAAKMQSLAIMEDEQILMRGICCLACGTFIYLSNRVTSTRNLFKEWSLKDSYMTTRQAIL